MSSQPSIRDQLEADAWRNHRRFARRQSSNRQHGLHRRPLRWEDRALLLISAVLLLLLIVRVETARADGPGDDFSGLEFQGGAGVQRTVALDTDIQVEVTGLAARINVTQVFHNSGKEWAEAIYRFPLPPGRCSGPDASACSETESWKEKSRRKEVARRQYQQAKSAGKTASLVEQQRANQFETRLANIGPGDDVSVTISFLAPVDYRDGAFQPADSADVHAALGAGCGSQQQRPSNSQPQAAPTTGPGLMITG